MAPTQYQCSRNATPKHCRDASEPELRPPTSGRRFGRLSPRTSRRRLSPPRSTSDTHPWANHPPRRPPTSIRRRSRLQTAIAARAGRPTSPGNPRVVAASAANVPAVRGDRIQAVASAAPPPSPSPPRSLAHAALVIAHLLHGCLSTTGRLKLWSGEAPINLSSAIDEVWAEQTHTFANHMSNQVPRGCYGRKPAFASSLWPALDRLANFENQPKIGSLNQTQVTTVDIAPKDQPET